MLHHGKHTLIYLYYLNALYSHIRKYIMHIISFKFSQHLSKVLKLNIGCSPLRNVCINPCMNICYLIK